MKARILVIVGTLCLQAAVAHAHIQLVYPPQRYTDQKSGPCGRAGDTGRGDVVTVLQSGSTLTVRWTETVNHPGHFRISFDTDGQDDFANPAGYDDYYTVPSVIADNIADTPGGGESSFDITLPDIECNNCTLQVVQVMTDKQPYGDGNDLYYQCADLTLTRTPADAGPGAPDAGEPGGGDGGGFCHAGPGSRPGPGGVVLLLLVVAFVRRRARA